MLLIKPSINGPELASADSSWKGVTADCPVKDSIIGLSVRIIDVASLYKGFNRLSCRLVASGSEYNGILTHGDDPKDE